MGLEAKGTARLDRHAFAGRAHLNRDQLEFRGETKLNLPFTSIQAAVVDRKGILQITHANGRVDFDLGNRATAEKWALRICQPKSLIDKLGLKPESRVALLGVDDAAFLAQAKQRLAIAPLKKPAAAMDFIFHAADSAAELAGLKSLRKHLHTAGAIWVISLKGKAAKIKDTDVMQAARKAGLVDNKVCSFSATHTALKLVIPKDRR